MRFMIFAELHSAVHLMSQEVFHKDTKERLKPVVKLRKLPLQPYETVSDISNMVSKCCFKGMFSKEHLCFTGISFAI